MFGILLLMVAVAAFTPSDYTNMQVIRENEYELHWNVDEEAGHITLAVRAATTGWVGFGLGEPTSGSMPGSDMVVGHVNSEGAVVVEDRYAIAKSTPLVDDCDHWTMVDGEEVAGWTTIEARRALVTDDMQDRPFSPGMLKILWAYSSSDSDTLAYHSSNRGPAGVAFYGAITSVEDLLADPNVEELQFPNNFTITSDVTNYHDAFFALPTIPIHIVGLSYKIQEEPPTAKYVHHFVLYGCHSGTFECDTLWAWAPGVSPLLLPVEAGFLVGEGSYDFLRQNTHYDNPDGSGTGLADSSGIRIFYTTVLRDNNAAVITVGDVDVSQSKPIDMGTGQERYSYDCPAACTNLWLQPVHAFAAMLHMHSSGLQAAVTHHRDGTQLDDIARVEFWDFAFQTSLPISTTINPGDELRTMCYYQQDSTRAIQFQDASADEMCVHFVYVWPPPTAGSWACGFYQNNTFCEGLESVVANPTNTDPDTVLDKKFGNAPASCPTTTGETSTTTESTSGTSTSSTSPTATTTSSTSTSATSASGTSASGSTASATSGSATSAASGSAAGTTGAPDASAANSFRATVAVIVSTGVTLCLAL